MYTERERVVEKTRVQNGKARVLEGSSLRSLVAYETANALCFPGLTSRCHQHASCFPHNFPELLAYDAGRCHQSTMWKQQLILRQ
eukprot:876179-Amphidinium_carterae.1